MKRISSSLFHISGPAFILIILGMALLPLYRYQINQDAITYISIAQKYARADWYNAVNGHAYPLISWIMAPLLKTGLDPLLASKIINLVIGFFTIIAMGALCLQLNFSQQRTLLCQTCTVPMVLYFAFSIITPDLLLSTILIFYHCCALSPAYTQKIRYGFLCGLISGLAYLTKSYCLLFFLCHFPLLNCWYYIKSNPAERKKVILGCASGLAIFLIICSAWSVIISIKYDKATSSNQGSIIMSAISPHRWKGPDHLIEPPNSTAVSIWEDPQEAFAQRNWSPFLSIADFKYWLHFVVSNLRVSTWSFFIFSPLGFCICIWFLGDLLRQRRFSIPSQVSAYIVGTCTIFAGGYCLLIVHERYLWPLFFLFLLLSLLGLSHLTEKKYFKNRVLLICLILIFCLSYVAMPADRLYKNIHTGREHAVLGQKLNDTIAPSSRLVFDTNWYQSLFLTFHLQSQIYGTADNIPTAQLEKELHRYAIDYFILWEHAPDEYPFLNNASEIEIKGLKELRIFKLTQQ